MNIFDFDYNKNVKPSRIPLFDKRTNAFGRLPAVILPGEVVEDEDDDDISIEIASANVVSEITAGVA